MRQRACLGQTLNYVKLAFLVFRTCMHPIIRIVCLIFLAVLLSRHSPWTLVSAGVLVMALYLAASVRHLSAAWAMLRRMRWLFLSVAVIYFWFTPGSPVVGPAPDAALLSPYLPTTEGIIAGSSRVAALAILVIAVNLLLQTTPRQALLPAILWLARPLRWLGLPHERFAVRMMLVIETVGEAQDLLGRYRRAPNAALTGEPRGRIITRISHTTAQAFGEALNRAHQAACDKISIPEISRPPAHQWLYPLSLAAVGVWINLA